MNLFLTYEFVLTLFYAHSSNTLLNFKDNTSCLYYIIVVNTYIRLSRHCLHICKFLFHYSFSPSPAIQHVCLQFIIYTFNICIFKILSIFLYVFHPKRTINKTIRNVVQPRCIYANKLYSIVAHLLLTYSNKQHHWHRASKNKISLPYQ